MSKRTIAFLAIVIAGLAFSLAASARDVGSIGVVIRPVIVSPEGDEASGEDAPGEVCTTEGMCWDV